MSYTNETLRTVSKYGDEDCIGAYNLYVSVDNLRDVADVFEVTVSTVRRLIKAGKELVVVS